MDNGISPDNQINGTPVIHLAEVDSTNNEAKRLIAAGNMPPSLIIVANRQSAGRGRSGKSFYSAIKDAIYMTVVFESGKIDNPASVTIAAAVAVAKALENRLDVYPKIKWVNDLFYNGRKFCGILSERVGNYIIVGIGINCNASQADFPPELGAIAGSIPLYGITKNELIAEIFNNLRAYLSQDFTAIITEYRNRSLMAGKRITYYKNNIEVFAIAIGIDDEGRLLVKTDNGDIHQLSSGEVIIVDGIYAKS